MDRRATRREEPAASSRIAGGRIETWQSLLRQALEILDSAGVADWRLGGGTVLMLRHRHRFTRGVDIFVPDARVLRHLPVQLRDKTHVEGPGFLRLYLPEGEIDFVASGRITADAPRPETILGREMLVETSAEILARKIWHRAARFTAADLVDLAVVAKHDPAALALLQPVLAARRAALLDRLARQQLALREGFAALDLLEFRASFDECLELARRILGSPATSAEQPRAEYRFALGRLALAGRG